MLTIMWVSTFLQTYINSSPPRK